jgi:spoIIIJ-associated protein
MNERTTLEKIAPTVEEAVADGLADLGLTAESVNVEVLDPGSRGLFGVGSRQARVRLTVIPPVSAVENCAPEKEPNHQAAPAQTNTGIPNQGLANAEEGKEGTMEVTEDVFDVLDDNLLFISRQTVATLLEKMKVDARIEVRYGEPDEQDQRPVMIDLQGENLGILVGRRAETLNALQYLVNLIVSKQVEHWVQVMIDVQGYRVRHERQLRQMAQRMADQAVKAGRRQILEPMSAADRRIIHLELRDHPGVTTESVGEEPKRKVTIVPKE